MRTFSIRTLGCKVNQYESQQIREFLEHLGLCPVEPPAPPDLVVVNTCCVTHTASSKSRQYIRQARKEYPDALIIVSGCLPTVNIGELKIPTKNVYVVRDRSGLAATLKQLVCGQAVAPVSRSSQYYPNYSIKAKNGFKIKHKNKLCDNDLELPILNLFKDHTRAFLKVQDGCDGYCSYCIVPKTRPFVHSKPVEKVLYEAQTLVNSGHKEIVLTGVFLGAYGRDSVRRKNWPHSRNDRLARLLDKVAKIPHLARIRLSSLEPSDVTDRLLDTFCANPNIMPHLHLSLQSGSNAILKKMCRQYTIDEFRKVVDSIQTRLDRPAITTDIIVGFPGETDADFQQTMDIAKEVGFAKMHIFSYSPRPGTAAVKSNNIVDKKTIKRRSEKLHEVGNELGWAFRQQFFGETAEILIEKTMDDGRIIPSTSSLVPRPSSLVVHGRSERYFQVFVENQAGYPQKNDLVQVRLIENRENDMIGTLLR
ncbi:MAG: tRNA (N(6)-L-threonylcarbamoyladenosine(37)-C(2))-methylthiotransferase MtaB [Sedimentisphaerales bacterium]|nr:tRNA (N(6)-L-threonylcarbamoyladenosine(37)-C(2))-methylthiotransferase MtaB [Sedimentisphaerales bacterium]